MKKIMISTLLVALGGFLVAQVSFAGDSDDYYIAMQCATEAKQLKELQERNPSDKCSGDVGVAAAYLDAASIQVRHQRYDKALVSLHYSENELKAIAYSRTYCGSYSQLVKPSIAKVIILVSELSILEYGNKAAIKK